MPSYTTYQAKARFSELLRRVRNGERVTITYHGDEVAELCPLVPPLDEAAAVRRLEERGVLTPPRASTGPLKPLASRPGALQRFLDERE